MSYCVHCGVQLASYQKECPLCGTPVNDPNPPEETEPRFVDELTTKDKNVNRYFLVNLITVIMIVPIFVSCLVDFIVNTSLSWSLYVAGGMVICWIWFVFPYRYHLNKPYWYIAIDYLAALIYLYIIYYLTSGIDWFLSIGFPITTYCLLWVLSILFIVRRNLNTNGYVGWIAISTSLLPMVIDVTIQHATNDTFQPAWSYWVTVPLLTIGVIFVIISRSHKLSSWIQKNLFV